MSHLTLPPNIAKAIMKATTETNEDQLQANLEPTNAVRLGDVLQRL